MSLNQRIKTVTDRNDARMVSCPIYARACCKSPAMRHQSPVHGACSSSSIARSRPLRSTTRASPAANQEAGTPGSVASNERENRPPRPLTSRQSCCACWCCLLALRLLHFYVIPLRWRPNHSSRFCTVEHQWTEGHLSKKKMSVYVTIILASCISSRHHLIQKSLYCARILYIAVLRTSDCHTQQCSDHGAHAQERHTCHSLHQITHGEFSCNKTSSECSCDV